MLSSNPALSPSPQPEFYSARSLPARGGVRASSNQVAAADGHASPRQHPSPQPVSHSRPSSQHQYQGFNAPRPSLSPLQEYHSGFSDEDLGSPSFPYSPANNNHHRRQQSFPNLLPLSFRSRTPSPSRKTPRIPEQMPYTGDGRNSSLRLADSSPRGGLASWLSGTAAGNALGMISTNSQEMPRAPTLDVTPDTTPTKTRGSTNASVGAVESTTPKSTVTATASRFMSAISSRFTPVAPTNPAMLDDELCNLDVEATLFAPGSPVDRDAFSPAAFKNLQLNAVGLLTRMQIAYRERVVALRDLQAERSAQRDELEEAETRAQHLKMQLEGMALKAQDHERAMQQLMDELAAERKVRAEERMALLSREKAFAAPMSSEGSVLSEDLGVDDDRQQRRWKRKSGGSTTESGAGFDTDEESAGSESVFSRCRSPTHGAIDGSLMDATTLLQQRSSSSLAPPPSLRQPRAGQQQISTFQKIIKNISGETEDAAGTNGCRNCKGQDASMAWDTVSLLRDENRHLKHRVGQLEVAVEGALDFVNGIGL